MALVETGGRSPPTASWHMQRQGTPYGPYTDRQFQQMMAASELLGSDLVWRDGMPEWLTLSDLYPDLFPPESPADMLASVASSPAASMAYAPARPRSAKKSNFGLIATLVVVLGVVPLIILIAYLATKKDPPKPVAPPPPAVPASKRSIFSE